MSFRSYRYRPGWRSFGNDNDPQSSFFGTVVLLAIALGYWFFFGGKPILHVIGWQ